MQVAQTNSARRITQLSLTIRTAIKILISCRNLYLKFFSYSGDAAFPFSILIVFRSVLKKKKQKNNCPAVASGCGYQGNVSSGLQFEKIVARITGSISQFHGTRCMGELRGGLILRSTANTRWLIRFMEKSILFQRFPRKGSQLNLVISSQVFCHFLPDIIA